MWSITTSQQVIHRPKLIESRCGIRVDVKHFRGNFTSKMVAYIDHYGNRMLRDMWSQISSCVPLCFKIEIMLPRSQARSKKSENEPGNVARIYAATSS